MLLMDSFHIRALQLEEFSQLIPCLVDGMNTFTLYIYKALQAELNARPSTDRTIYVNSHTRCTSLFLGCNKPRKSSAACLWEPGEFHCLL